MPTNNVQPTYTEAMARGLPGQVANGETSNRISRTCEDAAGIPFGAAVFRGASPHGCTATPTAGKFLGIAIIDRTIVPAAIGGTVDVYPQYSNVAILAGGVVFVTAGEAVTEDAPAYVTAGKAIVDTVGSNIAIPAVFDEAAANAAPVKLRVSLAAPVTG
jgi:hypothetical protein